jgi:hypothetical protein
MWPIAIRTALQVLAGLGLGDLFDRFVKPKVPAAYYPEPIGIGFSKIPRVAWIVLVFVLAVIAMKFVGRKLNLKLLK